jgi:hypothetical protein
VRIEQICYAYFLLHAAIGSPGAFSLSLKPNQSQRLLQSFCPAERERRNIEGGRRRELRPGLRRSFFQEALKIASLLEWKSTQKGAENFPKVYRLYGLGETRGVTLRFITAVRGVFTGKDSRVGRCAP